MDQHMNVPGADISTASDRVTTQDTCTRVCCHLWPLYCPPPAAEATRVSGVRVTSVVAALARQPPVDTPILQLPTQLSSALPLATPAQTGTLNRRKLRSSVQNHYDGYFNIRPRPSTTISPLRNDENKNLLLYSDKFCSVLFIGILERVASHWRQWNHWIVAAEYNITAGARSVATVLSSAK